MKSSSGPTSRMVFAGLSRIFGGKKATIPYLATFVVPAGFKLPEDFNPRQFEGLLFCHLTRGNTTSKLNAYWIDKESFELFAEELTQNLGLSVPEFEGAAIKMTWREEAKVRVRFSAREWVLAIFAIVGAILGLRDYAAVLFAAPDVALSYANATPTNAVVGEDFKITLNVTSEVRFAPARVTCDQASIDLQSGHKSVALDCSPKILPNLGAGQSASFTLSGSAPQSNPKAETPDRYSIAVRTEVKAGLVPTQSAFYAPEHEFWVWPPNPEAPGPSLSHVAAKVCELRGVIYVSKLYPQGLEASFTLTAPAGLVSQMYITGPANSTPEHFRSDTKRESTLKIEYQTPPLNGFQQYRYSAVLLLTKEASQSECQSLASDLKPFLQLP